MRSHGEPVLKCFRTPWHIVSLHTIYDRHLRNNHLIKREQNKLACFAERENGRMKCNKYLFLIHFKFNN